MGVGSFDARFCCDLKNDVLQLDLSVGNTKGWCGCCLCLVPIEAEVNTPIQWSCVYFGMNKYAHFSIPPSSYHRRPHVGATTFVHSTLILPPSSLITTIKKPPIIGALADTGFWVRATNLAVAWVPFTILNQCFPQLKNADKRGATIHRVLHNNAGVKGYLY